MKYDSIDFLIRELQNGTKLMTNKTINSIKDYENEYL